MSITTQQITDGLLQAGAGWAGQTVTFSIPGAQSNWSSSAYTAGSEPFNAAFGILNADQAAAFRLAIDAWDSLIKLTLTETNDLTAPGQIRVAFTNDGDYGSPNSYAYAYQPVSMSDARSGDIWIDDENKDAPAGSTSYFYATLVHELGHALGLKHSFEGTPLPTEFDNIRYTAMSYTTIPDGFLKTFSLAGSTLTGTSIPVNAASPMLLDVIAIQAKYGADTSHAIGDTTYAWSQDFNALYTMHDAGGTDTFDLSAHTRGSVISLIPGSYSSIGYYSVADQVRDWTAKFPVFANFIASTLNQANTYTWSSNFALAPDTIIERVLGGSGADTVVGNDAGNTIMAGPGNDVIQGGAGFNFLRGDEGSDSIQGGTGFDDANGNMGNDTIHGGAGDDYSVGGKDNDLLFGDTGADIVWGNLGNDTCEGGDGNDQVRGGQGDDSVSGGAGDDFVSGDRGSDTITGGAGADRFHGSQDAGLDRVLDFSLAQGDRVMLDPGTVYTLGQLGADTVIDMGTPGNQMILVGVQLSTLTDGWIYVG